MKLLPVFHFAAFVLWLLAVPMDGPLPTAMGIPEATRFFLLPHVASLTLAGLLCPPRIFNRLARVGCGLTVLFTLALPFQAGAAPYLLPLIGLVSGPVSIGVCLSLRLSAAPVAGAAWGLVIANLLLIPLEARPGDGLWPVILVALPLLAGALPASRPPLPAGEPAPAAGLGRYLPFVLVFQIVSGLMYSFIMPAYHQQALIPGAELPFYVLAVLGAVWIVQKSRDLLLVCGIVLGMVAFALLQGGGGVAAIHLSMFAMQAAAGFIDLFLLAFLLAEPRPVRAFGLGLAIVCLGIAAGKAIGFYLGNLAEAIALSGHLTLNLGVLTLYFLGRYHYHPAPAPATAPVAPPDPSGREDPGEEAAEAKEGALEPAGPAPPGIRVPDNLRLLLSHQEYQVLLLILGGKTYRQAAGDLGISESSVKTYMGRIYTKLKVSDRKGLLEALAQL